MNPYSHLVIASKMEKQVKPDDLAEYYWGAVAPDVRYPASMQRSQTHLPPEEILAFFSLFPHLKSFLQGYLLHCLVDEIELERIFFRHLPFFLLRAWMNRTRIATVLELYYFDVEKVDLQVSGNYNEVLSRWGVSAGVSTRFADAICQYTHSPTPETRFADLFRMLELENDQRIEKYRSEARAFQNSRWLRKTLFEAIRAGGISEQIISLVKAALEDREINPSTAG